MPLAGNITKENVFGYHWLPQPRNGDEHHAIELDMSGQGKLLSLPASIKETGAEI